MQYKRQPVVNKLNTVRIRDQLLDKLYNTNYVAIFSVIIFTPDLNQYISMK